MFGLFLDWIELVMLLRFALSRCTTSWNEA